MSRFQEVLGGQGLTMEEYVQDCLENNLDPIVQINIDIDNYLDDGIEISFEDRVDVVDEIEDFLEKE
jgi:hypothetical protein